MNKQLVAKELVKIAQLLTSYEFATQDALDKYLQDHPGADKSNHRVKEDLQHEKRLTHSDVDQAREHASMSHATHGPDHPRTQKLVQHARGLRDHKQKQDQAISKWHTAWGTHGRDHPHTKELRENVKKVLKETPEKKTNL